MKKINFDIAPLANREFLFKKLKNRAFNSIIAKTKPAQKPFITVSREPGSGGRHIARLLAEHLCYKFYDREILEKLDEKKLFDLYDEKELSALDEFINAIVSPQLESQDEFVEKLTNMITSLTLRGKCVILGRGANFFTDHKFGFHVRITAPFEYRVEKTVKYEKMSYPKAVSWVKQVSRERNKFVEKYFTKRIDDSEHYDLILNRAYYTMEQATHIIINAFKKKINL